MNISSLNTCSTATATMQLAETATTDAEVIINDGTHLLGVPRLPVEPSEDAIKLSRKVSNDSGGSIVSHTSSVVSMGHRALLPDGFCPQSSTESFLPTPLFAAKIKRQDGSKVFINVGTNDTLLSTETIVRKHTVPDKSGDLMCYDYVIHPERAAVYILLTPDLGSSSEQESSNELIAARNSIVYDAVKLISLKYGNLGLTGIAPSYPETKNNHKGKIQPFERSPSKTPQTMHSNNGAVVEAPVRSFTGSIDERQGSGNIIDPPALLKGWVTVLGSGGKGLIGIGNKKRFIVLDAGLMSLYKKESDTPPYGHHKKDSIVLDRAVILDNNNNNPVSVSQRRTSLGDSGHTQHMPVQAKRRSSVFGVKKEDEAKRIFINSAHGGKRIDLECDSVDDRIMWSSALLLHAEYAACQMTQPSLITESFVDENHSDNTSAISEVDNRNSTAGSSMGVKALRRSSVAPTTWAAYFPYMQEGETVLEAGQVTMRIGLVGRYSSPTDLVRRVELSLFAV